MRLFFFGSGESETAVYEFALPGRQLVKAAARFTCTRRPRSELLAFVTRVNVALKDPIRVAIHTAHFGTPSQDAALNEFLTGPTQRMSVKPRIRCCRADSDAISDFRHNGASA